MWEAEFQASNKLHGDRFSSKAPAEIILTPTSGLRVFDEQIIDVKIELHAKLTETLGVEQPLLPPIVSGHNLETVFHAGILVAALVTFVIGHSIFGTCQL